jgi:hypothetical protein
VQLHRGPGEAPLGGDPEKHAQLGEFHDGLMISITNLRRIIIILTI